MFPSWHSLLHWKPLKMEGLRRAGDGMKTLETVDLTTDDEERPVLRLYPIETMAITFAPSA